jgi:hypothetical protein
MTTPSLLTSGLSDEWKTVMKIHEIDWHGRGTRRFDLPGDDPIEDQGNPRERIGGNHPPAEAPEPQTTLQFAATAMDMLAAFLNDNPVIETGEQANAAKVHIDTARGCLDGMEKERDAKVRPLNERVAEINGTYKAVSTPFKRVLDQVRERLTGYAQRLERERMRIADEKRRIAEAAIAAAREAERFEQEAKDNAKQGEVDAGVAEAILEADRKFAEAQKADRQARVAERDEKVRIGGGTGRSLGMRTITTLTLDDPLKAVLEMGVSEKTRESILSDARAYRKLNGRWPAGVSAVETQTL